MILSGRRNHVLYSSSNDFRAVPPEILSLGFPTSCGDVQSQSISLVSRTGQKIIYQDFSSIYKRIVYSKSKRLEMLDLLKKKGNCTILAATIKAWNSWVETTQSIGVFVFCFFCCCKNSSFS